MHDVCVDGNFYWLQWKCGNRHIKTKRITGIQFGKQWKLSGQIECELRWISGKLILLFNIWLRQNQDKKKFPKTFKRYKKEFFFAQIAIHLLLASVLRYVLKNISWQYFSGTFFSWLGPSVSRSCKVLNAKFTWKHNTACYITKRHW